MAGQGEDLKREFVEFLESLPEDKRNLVINKLKEIEPSDREEAIKALLQAGAKAKSQAAQPAAAPVQNMRESFPATEPAPRAASPVSVEHRAARPSTEEASASPVKTSAPSRTSKKKLNPSVKYALTGAAAALIVGGVIFFGFMGGKDLFAGNKAGESDPSAMSGVTETAESGDPSGITETSETTIPEPTETPTPTPTPGPTPVPVASDAPDLTGLVIVIDPGHQQETDEVRETVASWMDADKPRCTCGCEGVATGVPEYAVTLDYALFMESYLEQCGANVILTRTENDVNISNQERAFVAVANDADVFIRLHADAANDSLASGVRVFVPDRGDYTDSSSAWGNALGNAIAEAEGMEFLGVTSTYHYTGLNYANTIPSFQVSLGYLSNSDDEAILVNEDNQYQVASAVLEFLVTFTE
ncbi:MAG: N-acetylmuramoyl-L-alanine amidase [Clostridiales bacterium]|nr:N-acetylmuramoyl-L-alanine amidase [Clostridiales bacterium]